MKRVFFCLLAVALCLLVGCGARDAVTIETDYRVITVDAARIENGTTLREYMDLLVSDGTMTYEMQSGMLMTLDGVESRDGRYWLLYTDDPAYENGGWGTCIYEGKTYGSATTGADALTVTGGCTYIWHLQEVTP